MTDTLNLVLSKCGFHLPRDDTSKSVHQKIKSIFIPEKPSGFSFFQLI